MGQSPLRKDDRAGCTRSRFPPLFSSALCLRVSVVSASPSLVPARSDDTPEAGQTLGKTDQDRRVWPVGAPLHEAAPGLPAKSITPQQHMSPWNDHAGNSVSEQKLPGNLQNA